MKRGDGKNIGHSFKRAPYGAFYKGEERIGNKNEMLDVRGLGGINSYCLLYTYPVKKTYTSIKQKTVKRFNTKYFTVFIFFYAAVEFH